MQSRDLQKRLKFKLTHTDRQYINNEGMSIPNQTVTRLRRQGMPGQQHVIPDISVLPWENKRDKYENKLISILDHKRKVG